MSKRNKRYEEEVRFGICDICDNEIPIEFYCARGDSIFCEECSAEYLIKSLRPLRLMLLEADYDDDFYMDLDFN